MNHKILGAQHLMYMKKVSLSSHPKANVCCLWHPGASSESTVLDIVRYNKSGPGSSMKLDYIEMQSEN